MVAAATLAACSSGSGGYGSPAGTAATQGPAGPAATVMLNQVSDATLGAHLTGDGGRTLYVLTTDGNGTSTCAASCATTWPPFTLQAGQTVKAGDGVTGAIASLTRSDGSLQVTYAGSPLYYFSGDSNAGDVNGQGVGGVWFVAATSGGPGGLGTGTPAPTRDSDY